MTIPALSRIKITLADPEEAYLVAATNSLASYADIYADCGGADGGEAAVQATIRAVAGIIAAYYAQQPTSVSGGGEGVTWTPERIAFYERLRDGAGAVAAIGPQPEPPTDTLPFAFAIAPGRRGR